MLHSSSVFRINTEVKIQNMKLSLFDVSGKMVQHIQITNPSTVIYRNDLADGIYFYRLTNESKQQVLASGKFVVE